METTPLLASEEPFPDNISNSSPTSFRRRTPTTVGHSGEGAISRLATQINDIFSSNRSPETPSSPDIEQIYSYLGESVIVTFLSACCLVIFTNNPRLHFL